MDSMQKALEVLNITTDLHLHKYMESVLKGDAKAKFTQQANLVGRRTVANFNIEMVTMTAHIFPVLAYQDQRRCMFKETKNNENKHFYLETNAAEQLPFPLSARLCGTDSHSFT